MAEIKYPFGACDVVTLSATGAQAITITDNVTIIDGVTTEATGNRTLNLTIASSVGAGALIYAKLKTNGTETTIAGTGMTFTTITGAAGKTKTKTFIYDGTAFLGTNEQIN